MIASLFGLIKKLQPPGTRQDMERVGVQLVVEQDERVRLQLEIPGSSTSGRSGEAVEEQLRCDSSDGCEELVEDLIRVQLQPSFTPGKAVHLVSSRLGAAAYPPRPSSVQHLIF